MPTYFKAVVVLLCKGNKCRGFCKAVNFSYIQKRGEEERERERPFCIINSSAATCTSATYKASQEGV